MRVINNVICLSHTLHEEIPAFGSSSKFQLENTRSISSGDSVNESFIHMSAHVGTHIDLPLHFYKNGQSIEDFSAEFWIFHYPVLLTIQPKSQIIYQEIVDAMMKMNQKEKENCDVLIIKTSVEINKSIKNFWHNHPGFSPDLYQYFRAHMPSLRIFGFDSISLSSYQNKDTGKKTHLAFLNPIHPILILEDMDLGKVNAGTAFKTVIISPLRISHCDGLPCTVFGIL